MQSNIPPLKIIHFALVVGALMQLFVLLFVVVGVDVLQFNFNSIFLYVLVAMWAILPFAGKFMYDKLKNGVVETDSETKKLQQYTSAKIIVWATLEGLALFSAVLLVVEPNMLFLISALCAIGMLFLKRTTLDEQQRDFKITNELK